jgi:two-component system alkaline phosphatase synthesis response regulator PhoP
MQILVIDNQADQVDQFHQALTKAGFQVRVCNTGVEGLEIAPVLKPNHILLGDMLPHMTGNEVLKALKNNQITANIPVIILTHFNDKALIQEAMDLGAEEYILKHTIAPADLIEKINTVLKAQNGGTGWQDIDANELF